MSPPEKKVFSLSQLFWIAEPKGRLGGSRVIYSQTGPTDVVERKEYNDAQFVFLGVEICRCFVQNTKAPAVQLSLANDGISAIVGSFFPIMIVSNFLNRCI
jgi:hypothetical protein